MDTCKYNHSIQLRYTHACAYAWKIQFPFNFCSHLEGPGMWGTYPDAVLPGLGVVEGGQTSTGSIVAWFRRLISGEEGEPVPYEDLNREAEVLPIGAEGLVRISMPITTHFTPLPSLYSMS
ncbi:unnamed protein product [Choristocarpus tenellus]